MKHQTSRGFLWLLVSLSCVASGCKSDESSASDAGGGASGSDAPGVVTLSDGGHRDDAGLDAAMPMPDPDSGMTDGSAEDSSIADVSALEDAEIDSGDATSPECVPVDEACNDVDDDCDDRVDEDLDLGRACDGEDDDECKQGRFECGDDDDVICVEAAVELSPESCDEIDNDCDDAIDEDFTDLEDACDGTDSDLCTDGVSVCHSAGDRTRCDDDTASLIDLCNGADDDCDPSSADGSEDSRVGGACDGVDSDLCTEGVYTCTIDGLVCSDATGSTLDLCNGANDDCDAASADGSEEATVGNACDGADSDLCAEGVIQCNGVSLSCSDSSGSTLDLCNGTNDDCDGASADGSEEPTLSTPCDGSDSDLCTGGTLQCMGSVLGCTNDLSGAVETCNGLDDDCDDTTDEGFVRDDNPVCSLTQVNLGSVSGDLGAAVATDTRHDEEWERVRITETNSASIYLSARITLQSAPGTDFDLYVYCVSCGGTLAGSSLSGNGTDSVVVRAEDTNAATDNSFDVIIEVRHFSSTVCADWTLTVTGNEFVSTATCSLGTD